MQKAQLFLQHQVVAPAPGDNRNSAFVCPSMQRLPDLIFVRFDNAGSAVGNDHARNPFLLAPSQLLPNSRMADEPISQPFPPQNRPAHRRSITNIKLNTLESP